MSTRMAGLRQGDGCVSFTSLQSFHRGWGSGSLPEASMYACNSKAAGWGLKSQKQTPQTFKINLSPVTLSQLCCRSWQGSSWKTAKTSLVLAFWTTGSESPVTLPWGRACPSTSCLTFNSLHCQLPVTVSTPGGPRSAQWAPSILCVAWLAGEAEEPAPGGSVSAAKVKQG